MSSPYGYADDHDDGENILKTFAVELIVTNVMPVPVQAEIFSEVNEP